MAGGAPDEIARSSASFVISSGLSLCKSLIMHTRPSSSIKRVSSIIERRELVQSGGLLCTLLFTESEHHDVHIIQPESTKAAVSMRQCRPSRALQGVSKIRRGAPPRLCRFTITSSRPTLLSPSRNSPPDKLICSRVATFRSCHLRCDALSYGLPATLGSCFQPPWNIFE